MEFRWIAILTLWTLLVGPVFDSPLHSPKSNQVRSNHAKIAKVHKLPRVK